MFLRLKFTAATLLLAVGSLLTRPAHAQGPPPTDAVSYQTFYDALSPYGIWVNDPDYGYAWVPSAGPDFQPYRTNGHWVYTDYGWTWVSDYTWGWAPFHYGRWRYSDGYGWLWVPGYTWGPAWVAWRQSAGYYGWAPLGPPPVRSGLHLNIGFSFSFGDAPAVPDRWCFVPAAYVASPRIATYYVPPAQTTVVYNNTTVIQNTYVNNSVNVTNINNTTVVNNNRTVVNNGNPGHQGGRRAGGAPSGSDQPAYPAGPDRAEVEKATGQAIKPLAVTNRATPGAGLQGQSLALYRPQVAAPTRPNRGAGAGPAAVPAPAPQKVVPLAEAANQARRADNANRGLMRDNAVQHLSSTDPDPIQGARARQAAARPAQANEPGPKPSNNAPASAGPVGAPNPANPNARPNQPARLNGQAGGNLSPGTSGVGTDKAGGAAPRQAQAAPANSRLNNVLPNRAATPQFTTTVHGNQPNNPNASPAPTNAPLANRPPRPASQPNQQPPTSQPALRPQPAPRPANQPPPPATTRPQPAPRPANQPRPPAPPRPQPAPHPGGGEHERR